MKAASFEYVRAESVEHALQVLGEHGLDGKLIAGGQSLVPMMAMRLARPAVLIDVNRLQELKQQRIGADTVTMGAATRQRDVEHDPDLPRALPLVLQALRWVGHIQTRNRGTVGGSLAHADPSAELPLAAAVLQARLRVCGPDGAERTSSAADFFQGPMFTSLVETECLVEIEWPIWSGTGVVAAFEEVAMRHGDFAMASGACQLQIDADQICRRAAIGMGGVDAVPLVFPDLAQQLVGQRLNASLIRDVARQAAERAEPGSDLHADAEYRRQMGALMLERAIGQAAGVH